MMSLNQKIENIEKNQMIFLGLKMTILKLKKLLDGTTNIFQKSAESMNFRGREIEIIQAKK